MRPHQSARAARPLSPPPPPFDPATPEHEVTVNRLKHATQAEMVVSDEHPGLINKTCLLVACHRSTQTKDRKKTFTNTVKAALAVFPANAIFVCDNGWVEGGGSA